MNDTQFKELAAYIAAHYIEDDLTTEAAYEPLASPAITAMPVPEREPGMFATLKERWAARGRDDAAEPLHEAGASYTTSGQSEEYALEEMVPVCAAAPSAPHATRPEEPGDLSGMLDALDEPFSTTLLALIDARGLDDAQVYKRANMSRQLFSKIRSDPAYRPTKKTVLALAVALQLTLPEAEDLLRRAGFALSHASKADVIVEYFLRAGNPNLFTINEALYHFDQPLL